MRTRNENVVMILFQLWQSMSCLQMMRKKQLPIERRYRSDCKYTLKMNVFLIDNARKLRNN